MTHLVHMSMLKFTVVFAFYFTVFPILWSVCNFSETFPFKLKMSKPIQ